MFNILKKDKSAPVNEAGSSKGGMLIPLGAIDVPEYAMRSESDPEKMAELIESIRASGLIQPIVVAKKGSKYEIVAGFRRYSACTVLGMKEISCVISGAEGMAREVVKMHENIMREDINIIDEAVWLTEIQEKYKLKLDKLAEMLHRSESYVRQRLQIMGYPDELRDALKEGKVSHSVAREFYNLKDKDRLPQYLSYAIESGLNSREAERWVNDLNVAATPEEEEQVGEGGARAPVKVNEAIVVCDACGTKHDFTKTRMVRLCMSCLDGEVVKEKEK